MNSNVPISVAVCAVTMLMLAQGATRFCYSLEPGSTVIGYAFCPNNSCYSVGGVAPDFRVKSKGCADKFYNGSFCQNMNFKGIPEEHVCFCNDVLCNASTSVRPPLLPLLLLFLLFPYLLQ